MKTIYSKIDLIQYLGNRHFKVMVYPVTGQPYLSSYRWHVSVICYYASKGVLVYNSYKKK